MKKIFIALFLLLAELGSSQVITVVDAAGGLPLESALVYNSKGESALTDSFGRVDLRDFGYSDSLSFQLLGYQTLHLSENALRQMDFRVQMSAQKLTLDEVLVAATKWEQDRRDIANRISVIAPREVEFQNPQTTADLVGLSGEVFIQKSQLGGGSPMIRGFATNRVLIVADGIRMNNAIFRSGNLQNIIALDPQAIEHTEVVFGPGSVIYGSDAIGGVMSFHTLVPMLSFQDKPNITGKVSARYASASEEKTLHGDVNLGFSKWAFRTSFSFSDFGDLRMGADGPSSYLRDFYVERQNGQDIVLDNPDPRDQRPSGYDQWNLLQKVRFRPNERLDFRYGFHYSRTTDVPRYDRLIELRNGLPRSAEWYYGPQVWHLQNLQAQWDQHTGLFDQARLIISYQHFQESRHDRGFGELERTDRTEKVDVIGINLDFNKKWPGQNQLFYGVEALFNSVSSEAEVVGLGSEALSPASTRYPDGSSWNSLAAYASLNHRFSDQLGLQVGARYNFIGIDATFDKIFFPFPFDEAKIRTGAVNGSVGVTWTPDETWQISTSISTGFRAPNIDDVGKVFDSEPGSVIVPNPDLQSEYAYNFDLGLSKTFGEGLTANLNAFYTILDNALIRQTTTFNGADSIIYDGSKSQVLSIQNGAGATVWGVQLGISGKFDNGIGYRTNFNYQDGEEETEDGEALPLRHAAPPFGLVQLSWEKGQFYIAGMLEWNGEISNSNLPLSEQAKPHLYDSDEEGRPYCPSWSTVSLKVRYVPHPSLSVTGGIENILDKRYRPYSSGIVAPGRNWILSAIYRF